MDFTAVDDYLHQLHYTDHYTELILEERERNVFTAEEMLKNHFDEKYLTVKVIALQTLYMIEGEEEEFAKFKRQGVKSFSIKGMSFSFEGSNISPEVTALIKKVQGRASIGRLI
jgi:hypothetical protein